LEFDEKALKFLSRCENILYKRLSKKINELRSNPFPQDIKRVEGKKEKTFRVRIGDYRISYIVIKENNVLIITKIDKRPRAY
tara:strand:- start:514 stop:759 length:246 start_codon:yes stop_codon:yes gene_type:complete